MPPIGVIAGFLMAGVGLARFLSPAFDERCRGGADKDEGPWGLRGPATFIVLGGAMVFLSLFNEGLEP